MNPKLYPTTADAASVEALGTTASPLLAGFSITLIGLIAGNAEPAGVIMWPNITLTALTGAVVLFTLAVQFTVVARQFNLTQEEHKERTPEVDAAQRARAYGIAMESFWSWSGRAGIAFNFGLGLLLLGLAGTLLPPCPSFGRYAAVSVAMVSFAFEAVWSIRDYVRSRRFVNSLKPAGND